MKMNKPTNDVADGRRGALFLNLHWSSLPWTWTAIDMRPTSGNNGHNIQIQLRVLGK